MLLQGFQDSSGGDVARPHDCRCLQAFNLQTFYPGHVHGHPVVFATAHWPTANQREARVTDVPLALAGSKRRDEQAPIGTMPVISDLSLMELANEYPIWRQDNYPTAILSQAKAISSGAMDFK